MFSPLSEHELTGPHAANSILLCYCIFHPLLLSVSFVYLVFCYWFSAGASFSAS